MTASSFAPLLRVVDRLRRQGPAWIVRRVRFELKSPTTGPGRRFFQGRQRLSAMGVGLIRRLTARLGVQLPMGRDALVVFYDLETSPITFDVLWSVVGAELARRRAGLAKVCFLVVPGSQDGFREEYPEYEMVVSQDARKARLFNLLIPAFSLLPSTSGVMLLPSRDEARFIWSRVAHVYPPRYDPDLPSNHLIRDVLTAGEQGNEGTSCLQSPLDASKRVAAWVQEQARGRRLVTVTLRDYSFRSTRNSNLEAWVSFAKRLDPSRYQVVFLRDTGTTLEPLPPPLAGCLTFNEASWNLGLRMALYEASFMNLGVNAGPLLLCGFSKVHAPCLMFKMVADGPDREEAMGYMRTLGFIPEQTPQAMQPFHKWVWEEDTLEVIEREFSAMVSVLEQRPG